MSNYTKTTNFAAKDSLPSGNAAKIVKGTEIDTEFNNIATASATKANTNNAALTGTTTFETISDGTIGITAFVDEDNMASDSATLLPTQQSVKAYVDSQVTAQDLDVTDGSTSIDIDLDSESLGILGGTGIDSAASGTGVTLAIDSTVATLTGSQTLSNKTLSTPVVSGNLTTDGLLDGRDVAADGTKLDGIESGATADQTAAEIKTAYESNANTNAFTDADESKLDGIEASADVTDTANVTAAGALMDSELTSEASVKALNQGVATTDSPTFAGVTAPVTGNVTGNLTGNVTGNVTGDVTGDLTGDVTGNVTGNLTGNLTGTILTAAQTNITSVGTLGSLTVSGDVTVDTNTLKVDSTNNRVGLLNASPDVTLDVGSATDAVHVPTGTTAQRPTGAAGYFRYNSTLEQFEGYTDAWGAIGGGGGSNLVSDTMTGDGVDTTLTLSNDPLNENNTQVYIDGVYQNKDTYSVSGTTLTFSTAPPSGSAVEAMTIQPTAVNVPADASVTSAKLSGDLTLPGDLSFADNNKAIFGAGSDLQIYHDGSNSIIHETAAGSLILRGTNLNLQTDANVNYLQAVANGAVTLYHQSGGASAAKLATTSTGIDVTGSISADGLNLDGNIQGDTGQNMQVSAGAGAGDKLDLRAGDDVRIYVDGATAHKLSANFANNGDISFYNSAGTSQSLFWDSSAESLGIGTSSPASLIDAIGAPVATSGSIIRVRNSSATASNTSFGGVLFTSSPGTDYSIGKSNVNAVTTLSFRNGNTGASYMDIDSSGNVGIGTSSPSYKANVLAGAGTQAIFQAGQSGVSNGYTINSNGTSLTYQWYKDGSQAMTLDNSGNLLVNTPSQISAGKVCVQSVGSDPGVVIQAPSDCFQGRTTQASGTSYFAWWVYNGSNVGSITSTGSTTAYNTSSDQRLKENIADADDAGSKVDAIQVRKFDWIADGSHQDYGMIAQELQSVAPEAVSGDADSDEMMGVDYSKLVPMLVKEIQSLRARVAQLEN